MKISLIKLYGELGIFKPILRYASSLDIKQIMHDTLTFVINYEYIFCFLFTMFLLICSYLFSEDIETITPMNECIAVLLRAMTIYRSNEKEVWIFFLLSFKCFMLKEYTRPRR